MQTKILWVDDEINLLKPNVLFLEKKGYQVDTINNGVEALEKIQKENYAAILLDENMPGVDGLETLERIHRVNPMLPVVMITKSEEEDIMNEAIGSQITDYLIKPVNPHQIVLSLKKILEAPKIISEKTISHYQKEFRNISIEIMQAKCMEDWKNIYKKLIYWELKLEEIKESELQEVLFQQKGEANHLFFKYIKENYTNFLAGNQKQIMSHNAFEKYAYPYLSKDEQTILIVIDNLRYDQWRVIQPFFKEYYDIEQEHLYCSILPSATQYARNAFFAGMMPLEIEKRFPTYWLNDTEDGKKNEHEDFFLQEQLKRLGLSNLKAEYFKLLSSDQEKKLLEDFSHFSANDFTTIVYNFVDILSHAKTDNRLIAEIIRDDTTYRALTKNWFEHCYLLQLVKKAADHKMNLLLTTDHGTIFVNDPSKVIGDKETSTNLRYKLGKNLNYNDKEVLVAQKPEDYQLPKVNVSSKYIFAKNDLFFAYPNNYHHFVKYYKNTYQHGGISLEEMIIPFVVMKPK